MKKNKILLLFSLLVILTSCSQDGGSDFMDECTDLSKTIKSDDAFFIYEDYLTICRSEYDSKKDYENAVKNAVDRGWR